MGHFFWAVIRSNAWGLEGPASGHAEISAGLLKDAAPAWHPAETLAGRSHNKVVAFVLSMLGPPGDPGLTTHGAEANAILAFARTLLARHGLSGDEPAEMGARPALVALHPGRDPGGAPRIHHPANPSFCGRHLRPPARLPAPRDSAQAETPHAIGDGGAAPQSYRHNVLQLTQRL